MEVSERNWLNNVQTLYREGAIPEPLLSAGLAFMRLLQLAVVCRMPAGVHVPTPAVSGHTLQQAARAS